MTLSELATYYQQSAQAKGSWNILGHDWMVKNIDALALAIREFVQKNYLATFAIAGDNIEVYRALAYSGLSDSQFYTEEVINKGKLAHFGVYRSLLNDYGVCSN